ncbi:MAG: hypothetical protein ACRCVP_04305 [Shewanella xiamenensis]
MSKLDCTAHGVKKVVDEAEQLSLLILMLFDQSLDEEFLRSQAYPLLQKLNDDLSQVSSMILLQNQLQGGMGEAPMQSALKPSSC